MQTVWIIGAGKFGHMAVKRLKKRCCITLVDPDQAALDRIDVPGITKVCEDGVAFMKNRLNKDTDVAWIVPSLPVHLAWEWCSKMLGADRLIPRELPEALDTILPHPMRMDGPHIYVSHAGFICPDNCSEPDEICTVTKKPRKQDMFAWLGALNFRGYLPVVLQSRQLSPGVGGYSPKEIFNLLTEIERQKGNLLICTACRCHAVITGAAYGLPDTIKNSD